MRTTNQPVSELPQKNGNSLADTSDHEAQSASIANERIIDPRALPKLAHTEVLDAIIDGESFSKPDWESLRNEMLRRGIKHFGSVEKLRKAGSIKIVQSLKEDEGYKSLPDIGISAQRQDANGACRSLVKLAQKLGIGLDIMFLWHPNKEAAFPGEHGRLTILGVENSAVGNTRYRDRNRQVKGGKLLISIEKPTFERLQSYAKPLVDTADSVINRGLDALEKLETQSAPVENDQNKERTIDPHFLSELAYTKILGVVIDGENFSKLNWNSLRNELLHRGMASLGSCEELRKVCPVNMVQGKRGDAGFKYLPDIDVSVQGEGTVRVSNSIVTLAESLGIKLDVIFMWHPNEKAAFPGERGRLTIPWEGKSAGGSARYRVVGG